MKKFKLTKYEKEILRAYEAGEYRSVPNLKKRLKEVREIAKKPAIKIAKNKNINQGLPYQTLASSVLHKYAMS